MNDYNTPSAVAGSVLGTARRYAATMVSSRAAAQRPWDRTYRRIDTIKRLLGYSGTLCQKKNPSWIQEPLIRIVIWIATKI